MAQGGHDADAEKLAQQLAGMQIQSMDESDDYV